MTGKIICAGLGPGDPELMSVKADRQVRQARHVAYFRKGGKKGHARQMVDLMLRPDVVEYAMEYPVTTELPVDSPAYKDALGAFYDQWATLLKEIVQQDNVTILCEGDPFFYGSFMHLYVRLKDDVDIEVIPGITGMSGCWTATGIPMTWGDDVLTVLAGTMPGDELAQQMRNSDAFVVMKTGRNLEKVKLSVRDAGREEDAWLVEYGTMSNQKITKLQEVTEKTCPYFAIILAHGHGRRP